MDINPFIKANNHQLWWFSLENRATCHVKGNVLSAKFVYTGKSFGTGVLIKDIPFTSN